MRNKQDGCCRRRFKNCEGFISVIRMKNRISEHIRQHFNSSNYRLSAETKFLGKQVSLALICM